MSMLKSKYIKCSAYVRSFIIIRSLLAGSSHPHCKEVFLRPCQESQANPALPRVKFPNMAVVIEGLDKGLPESLGHSMSQSPSIPPFSWTEVDRKRAIEETASWGFFNFMVKFLSMSRRGAWWPALLKEPGGLKCNYSHLKPNARVLYDFSFFLSH